MKQFATLLALFAVVALQSRDAFSQPTEWFPRGRGGGGSLFNPAISPLDANDLYIGCDMSGVFHSTDGGLNFSLVNFRELTSNSYAPVRFSGNSAVLYALDSEYGARPVRSIDGGASWTPTFDPTNEEAYNLFVDPQHQNRVLLSSYNDLWFSNTEGASFTLKYTNANGLHLAGAFFLADTIYVATNVGLLRSSNAGSSFTLIATPGIPAGEGFISLAGSTSGGVTRLLVTTAPQADLYPGITGSDFEIFAGLYTLTLGNPSWTNRTASLPAGSIPFYVGMSQNEIDTMWAAGSNPPFYHPHVLRSTNGGANWTSVMQTVGNVNVETGWQGQSGDEGWGWGGPAQGFCVAPNDPWRALITDMGFAHLTTDGGQTFRAIYISESDLNPAGANTPQGAFYHSNGLEPTSVWHIHWSSPEKMFASWTDITAGYSRDGGVTWARPNLDNNNSYSVNTIYHVVQHANGLLYGAGSSVHDLYQSTYLTDARIDNGIGQLWLSSDSGATWTMLHDFQHPVVWLALDPTNSERLYASVVHSTLGGIFKTENLSQGANATWTRCTVPPRTEGHPYLIRVLNDGAVVCTFSGRRGGNPQVFTQSSGVFYSTDHGATWSDRSDPMMLYWTKDVVMDPHDASQNTWYAAVHRGWGGGAVNSAGGIFRSYNRGQTWTRICDELYCESCTVHPLDPDFMYVTTETNGLLHTDNLLDAQPAFYTDDVYPFMHPQRVFFNPFDSHEVWIANFGGGMIMGTTALPPPQNLTIYRVGNNLSFRWLPIENALRYKLWSSVNLDAPIHEWTLEATITLNPFTQIPLPAGLQRVYVVTAE
jgi:hypothetical protein